MKIEIRNGTVEHSPGQRRQFVQEDRGSILHLWYSRPDVLTLP